MGKPWGNGFPAWAIHHSPELEALEPDLGFPLNSARPEPQPRVGRVLGRSAPRPRRPEGPGRLPRRRHRRARRPRRRPPGARRRRDHQRGVGGHAGADVRARSPPGARWSTRYVQATWERITDRIRQAHPDLLVWWEPASTWNLTAPSHLAEPPLTPAIDDPQVAFAFHDYCAFGELSTYLGSPPELQQTCDVHHAITWQNAATCPGPHRAAPARDRVRQHRRRRRARALAPPVRRRLHGLAVLALRRGLRAPSGVDRAVQRGPAPAPRPHLPGGHRGDAGRPVLRPGLPARCGTRTCPAPSASRRRSPLSDVHYPQGYDVEVTGGHVVGTPSASIVLVDADVGATRVEVIVRRSTPGAQR